jgi:hypothetical protein
MIETMIQIGSVTRRSPKRLKITCFVRFRFVPSPFCCLVATPVLLSRPYADEATSRDVEPSRG